MLKMKSPFLNEIDLNNKEKEKEKDKEVRGGD